MGRRSSDNCYDTSLHLRAVIRAAELIDSENGDDPDMGEILTSLLGLADRIAAQLVVDLEPLASRGAL